MLDSSQWKSVAALLEKNCHVNNITDTNCPVGGISQNCPFYHDNTNPGFRQCDMISSKDWNEILHK